MKIRWMPILRAAGALIGVKIVGHYFGTKASFVALGALLLSWWLLHLYYKTLLTARAENLVPSDQSPEQASQLQLDQGSMRCGRVYACLDLV